MRRMANTEPTTRQRRMHRGKMSMLRECKQSRPEEKAGKERLNRFLARAGVASRRASDRLILAGEVRVNGLLVSQPGTLVDARADRVVCRGRRVRPPTACTYVILNKPSGYLVSAGDPHHSRTVYDLLTALSGRVFPVGRLDLDTRGMLMLTDDGDLAYRLMHPRYEVEKTYRAFVLGKPSVRCIRQLCQGVRLDDGVTAPAKVKLVGTAGGNSTLELTLHEGRKRQVKRMCEAVGHPVRGLERVAFAGITARDVGPGQWRHLTSAEVGRLQALVGLDQEVVGET